MEFRRPWLTTGYSMSTADWCASLDTLECTCLGSKTLWPRFMTRTISLKMSTWKSILVISAAKIWYNPKLNPQMNQWDTDYWFTYNETMTVERVTQAVSSLALQFGEDADPGAMSHPFGVALLFGGVEKGPQLFHMDTSGTFVQREARAIGSVLEAAQSSLQVVYQKSLTLEEAIILKQVAEEKLNATNTELAKVQPGLNFHMFTKEELEGGGDQGHLRRSYPQISVGQFQFS
ncbi:Proteasome subunit alpha type-5 [Lemmus lemmus]